MRIYILGICGTFMGSLATLAKSLGHEVRGCDANVYPPMSTQLQAQGIQLDEGYEARHLQQTQPELVIVGNAMSRGNPCVEYMLDNNLPYTSGPQWLGDTLLKDRWVLAVSGTHGKTTTASMLAWILEYAGLKPGFLIGGVPLDFPASARLGEKPFFVIEADEYDSAFFDKRSKFVHYHPRTLIINNIEFDHADIFDSLKDIQRQFHHLMRLIPSHGRVIFPAADSNIKAVLAQGCWCEQSPTGETPEASPWAIRPVSDNGLTRELFYQGQSQGQLHWQHGGEHNARNALAAIAAAHHVGVEPTTALAALAEFKGVKRRMELLYESPDQAIRLYDDFAHHPTAIRSTLAGLRRQAGDKAQILAVIEPRSNTMRLGTLQADLKTCADIADQTFWYQPKEAKWALTDLFSGKARSRVFDSLELLQQQILQWAQAHTAPVHIVVMSNGGFGGIHRKLANSLSQTFG